MHDAWWAGLVMLAVKATEPSIMTGGSPLFTWAVQFMVTLAIEVPMVLIAWRFRGCPGRLRPWLVSCVIGNLISHPAAIFLATRLGLPGQEFADVVNYIVLETGVIALEAWAFRVRATRSWTEAILMALVANAITAVFGAYLMFFTPMSSG